MSSDCRISELSPKTLESNARARLLKRLGLWSEFLRRREKARVAAGSGSSTHFSVQTLEELWPDVVRRAEAEERAQAAVEAAAEMDGAEFQRYLASLPEGEDDVAAVRFAVRTHQNGLQREFPSRMAHSLWTLCRQVTAREVLDLFVKTLPSKSIIAKSDARRDDGSASLETIEQVERYARDAALQDGSEGGGGEPGVPQEGSEAGEPVEAGGGRPVADVR